MLHYKTKDFLRDSIARETFGLEAEKINRHCFNSNEVLFSFESGTVFI